MIENVIFYAKHWYKETNVWNDIQICLEADGYKIFWKEDIIEVLTKEILVILKEDIKKYIHNLIFDITPNICWVYGYCDRKHRLKSYTNCDNYNHFLAIIYCYLHILGKNTTIKFTSKPNKGVLPFANIVTQKEVNKAFK